MASRPVEPGPLRVVASVVYWQARELPLLDRCVSSLLRQDLGSAAELDVVLVDNGSGGTPALAGEPRVSLIRLPENRGFAGGHNAGMRAALADRGAEFVLLFNSDAVAEDGMLRELLAAARGYPSAAFVAPILLRAREPSRLESAGQGFNEWTGRHTEVGRGERVSIVADAVRTVDAVSGCAILARRAAVESIGLLDEDLFAYFEDMDWCLRARRAGYTLAIVPRARVLHVGQGSTGGSSPLATYYSVRNHLVIGARYGRLTPWLLTPLIVAYHVAFLVRSSQRRTAPHLRALVAGVWAARTIPRRGRRFSADRH